MATEFPQIGKPSATVILITIYSRTSVARTLLVYHGFFELVLGSLGKYLIAADLGLFRAILLFYIEYGILCVLIRIASMRRF